MADKDISMRDIMNQLQGAISQMNSGFSKNQDSLDLLTKQVTDLSSSFSLAYDFITDLQEEIKEEKRTKQELVSKCETLQSENITLKA